MVFCCKLVLLAFALLWFAPWAHATDVFAFPEGAVQRDFVRLPSAQLGPDAYEAMIVRPARDGAFPLVVLNHGSPRERAKLKETRASAWTGVAVEFARQGYAAAIFLRQGFGTSAGPLIEYSGPCRDPDYIGSGRQTAAQIAEAVEALKRQPFVDARRVVVVGQSAGGFGALALAAKPPSGVVAVLNFAGGRGSGRPDQVCRESRLVEAVRTFGRGVRLPSLWVYTENDSYFRPELARAMVGAWREGGGAAEFIAAPAFGADGHLLFGTPGIPIWRGYVDGFLRALALPSWRELPDDTPPTVAKPAGLGPNGSRAFEEYRRSTNFHKAFAMSNTGHFQWLSGFATREEAITATRERCAVKDSCRVVLFDNDATGE
jgi:dienelactone hydrolase